MAGRIIPGWQHGQPPRLIIFDLDGTLVDSFSAICASVNHVRSQYGLSELPCEVVRLAVGNGLQRLLELTVGVGEPTRNEQVYHHHHPSVMASGTTILDGVLATLDWLSHQGVILSVCSNKPLALTESLLKEIGMAKYFSIVVGPESAPNRKPAPDMLFEAIRRAKVPKEQVLYVGDMTVDIDAARAAGIPIWAIPTGVHCHDTLIASQPARVLNRFQEILELYPKVKA